MTYTLFDVAPVDETQPWLKGYEMSSIKGKWAFNYDKNYKPRIATGLIAGASVKRVGDNLDYTKDDKFNFGLSALAVFTEIPYYEGIKGTRVRVAKGEWIKTKI